MIHQALVKVRADYYGNRIGVPEILNLIDDDGLDKLAKIYARMLKNDQQNEDEARLLAERSAVIYGNR